MYAILGATGQVGRAVVASLAADGHAARMRLIGRTPSADAPAGAAWHHADLRDGPAALAAALEGAEAAFVLNPVPVDAGDVHADAAALAGVIAQAVAAARCPRVVALSG